MVCIFLNNLGVGVSMFIYIHHKGFSKIPKAGDIAYPILKVKFKEEYKKIIKKKIIEEIAREILNNSEYLMKDLKPFLSQVNESDGESDNIGKNISIDTKLLMQQDVCHLISKNEIIVRKNNLEYDYLSNEVSESYRKYMKGEKAITKTEENQFKIIKKIIETLSRFNKKNILFIFPIPQMDVISMKTSNFSESQLWTFFWVLSNIKRYCKFKNKLYFAYPLINGSYNLIQIFETRFISEAFIECNAQKKYIESIQFGLQIKNKERDRFIKYTVEIEYERPCITNHKYLISNIMLSSFNKYLNR